MPGYGIAGPEEGGGLLDWGWAQMQLSQSHDYWLATTRPDWRPHVMPVWGAWNQGAMWFSASVRSRKVRNLQSNPACTITTDDARNPVVLEGRAELITNRALIAIFLNRINTKYAQSMTLESLDPQVNACFRVKPAKVIALQEDKFTGSPTRWEFPVR